MAILGQPSSQFLPISVDRKAAITSQPDTFERKFIEFLY